MIPLSKIVIHFQEHYGKGRYVSRNLLKMFSEIDLKMLVEMGILSTRENRWYGFNYYRLRIPYKYPSGTTMSYLARRQYAKDWQQGRIAA